MIDRRFIGHALPAFETQVDASRLRFFAEATGQTDPVYTDEAAARAAGHPSLPLPPTFLFCLEMEAPDPAAMRKLLGIDYRRLLHGEQRFRYHRLAHAGQRLRFEPVIADIYDRKNGALEFVVRETRVTLASGDPDRADRADRAEHADRLGAREPVPDLAAAGDPVADLRTVTVVRHA